MSTLNENGNRPFGARFLVVGIIIGVLFLFYIGRLFSIQVVQSSFYDTRADQVTKRIQIIPSKRGQVYDRNYDTPIATNYDSFVVILNPQDVPADQVLDMLGRLAQRLNVGVDALRKKLPTSLKIYHPIEIKSSVRYEDIVYLAEHKDDFPGLSWESRPVRYYPEGKSMAHVLGYVGEITPDELQVLYNRGYTDNSVIGKSGIEKYYDSVLRGKDGRRFSRVDASGRGVQNDDMVEVAPELGKNIVLTIDRHIQTLAERALGSRQGSILVLKPATGEILAMVSYPSYDPNSLYTDQSSATFARLSQDTRSPFLNRAIQSAAAPASTFKVLMTTAVLQENAFPKTSKILCVGSIQVGNRKFNCWLPSGHGYLDLFEALAQSCDVYFYTVGMQYLGVDKILDYAYKYGLGEITGVDLPGEIAGNVPSPEWKKDTYGVAWVGGDTANLSIGQGYLTTTTIQLADMVAGIVNGGKIYQPHLLKEVRDASTFEVVEENTPKLARQLDLRPDVIKDLQNAMRGTVVTGTAASVLTTKAVQIAAKTGTGQTTTAKEEDLNAWFVSYAPYNYTDINDVVVVVIWVDSSNKWDWWSPKAANIMYQGIFAHQTYEQAVAALQPWYYLQTPEPEPAGADQAPLPASSPAATL